MDIKNVLVPTDFSLPSKAAVNYGIALARRFRAKLTLLHVPDVLRLVAEAALIDPDLEEQLTQEAFEKLTALVAPEDQDDLDLRTVVKFGSVAKAILSTVKEQHADIVILGTHGHGRLGRWVLGSTTEAVLRKLAVPVLTVRETRAMEFNRILFATDLSESSIQALDFVLDLAQTLQADVTVIHCINKRKPASIEDAVREEMHELAIRQAKQKLALIITEGERRGMTVTTVLADGTAADEILKCAKNVGADLILLGITDKGTVERALIGATAEQVAREAHMPVLCVPVRVPAQAIRRTS